MKNNQFRKILKHDFSAGFSSNAAKYMLTAFLFSMLCVLFFNGVSSLRQSGQIEENASFMDCSIFVFKGMEVYIPSESNVFHIPITWLIIQVMVAFLILTYPTQDLHSYGIQILTRTNKKTMWWLSKCIWNMCTTIAFYIVGFGTILGFTIMRGEISLVPVGKTSRIMNAFDFQNSDLYKLSIVIFLLPMLTSIALSLLQMTIAFVLTPIYSYLIIICISVTSAYFYSPMLMGNFSMLMRSEIVFSSGINSFWAVFFCLCVIILSAIVGCIYFNKCDIIKKN